MAALFWASSTVYTAFMVTPPDVGPLTRPVISAAASLVRAKTGRDLFSTGEIDLEAGTGRIHRTMMQTKYDRITAELTTMYAPEPKLHLWVPVWFSERYSRDDGTDEVILCEAEYTNYRRFETRVRVR